MSGIVDFEPKLKSLDRIGPETTKAFEMLDSGASLSPQQCADLLEGLGQEADRLEAELNEAERTADDCGQIGRNETLLTLQAPSAHAGHERSGGARSFSMRSGGRPRPRDRTSYGSSCGILVNENSHRRTPACDLAASSLAVSTGFKAKVRRSNGHSCSHPGSARHARASAQGGEC